MPFFPSDGIGFHYIGAGANGKRPFIFQHGLGGDTDQTQGTFQPPLPCRLLTMDSRGHGETRPLGPEQKLSFDQFADDLFAFMRHIGLERAVIGGISMGAGLAVNFALRYPRHTAALVLVRPAWLEQPLPENLCLYPRIAALLREQGAQEGKRLFLQTPEYQEVLRRYPAGAASLAKQFDRPHAVETAALLERLPQDAPNRERAAWAGIQVPTLVLANDLDPVHPFSYGQALAAAIPGAILTRITSKEVDAGQHNRDIQQAVEQLFRGLDD